MVKWCHNSKTGEIFSYKSDGDLTDFPRGILLVYEDYLTTGLDSREKAEQWAKEWGACPKCRSARKSHGGVCLFCNTPLDFKQTKIVDA